MLFILLVVIVLVLVVIYYKVKYFTLRGPLPGLSPHVFFGNLIQAGLVFYDVSLPKAFSTFQSRFGDIHQFWFGPTRLIVVNGAGDVRHIFTNRHVYDQGDLLTQIFSTLFADGLICLKGEKYKRHASLTIPLFRRGKIISNLDVIVDCTDKLLSNWRTSPRKYVHQDIAQQCEHLMLAMFGWIAFDYDLGTLDSGGKNELSEALTDFLSIFEIVSYMPRALNFIYLKVSRRHRRAKDIIERYFNRMIDSELDQSEEWRAQRKRTSLIASLVASLQKNPEAEAKKSEEQKQGLSRREVLGEMLVFLVAGFESTAAALAWFIFLMSKNPRVQQKIKAELLNSGDQRHLSLDRLDSLVYLDCVIKEVLRYSPPINGTFRTLTVDDRLPESGTQLFKGDQVLVPFHNLAHDNRLWSIDPNLFYPERFLNEDQNHQLHAFIPFGSGHRQCIGQDLARFELKVAAARLMQFVTFGDGGPEVNSGGHLTSVAIKPRKIGVTINFD